MASPRQPAWRNQDAKAHPLKNRGVVSAKGRAKPRHPIGIRSPSSSLCGIELNILLPGARPYGPIRLCSQDLDRWQNAKRISLNALPAWKGETLSN